MLILGKVKVKERLEETCRFRKGSKKEPSTAPLEIGNKTFFPIFGLKMWFSVDGNIISESTNFVTKLLINTLPLCVMLTLRGLS